MGKINSKQKGARYEREVSAALREYGYGARRGVQYQGGADSPDVLGLPGIHIECKAVEKLNLESAFEQARRDAGKGNYPAVFHRRKFGKTKVTMELVDWINLYREWEASMALAEHRYIVDADYEDPCEVCGEWENGLGYCERHECECIDIAQDAIEDIAEGEENA